MNDENLNRPELVQTFEKSPQEFIFQWCSIFGHALAEMEKNPKISASTAIKSYGNGESLMRDWTSFGKISKCRQKIIFPAYDEYEDIFWHIRWKGEIFLFGLRTCVFPDGSIIILIEICCRKIN